LAIRGRIEDLDQALRGVDNVLAETRKKVSVAEKTEQNQKTENTEKKGSLTPPEKVAGGDEAQVDPSRQTQDDCSWSPRDGAEK
jgi:hypothetical protein